MRIEEFTQALAASEDPRAQAFRASIEAAKLEEFAALFALKPDELQKWLETQDGFLAMQPRLEKAKAEALARFREKDLPKLLNEDFEKRYAEKHPPENAELARLTKEMSEMKQKNRALELKTFAAKVLADNKLPPESMDFFVLDDEEAIKARVESISGFIQARVNEQVQAHVNKTAKPEPAGVPTPTKVALDPKAPPAEQVRALMEQQTKPQ